MMQTMLEKLELHEEKNLLIQGLPSSVEKQFAKLSFAKNVTPLLRSRRIDFALIFAVNQNQLSSILTDVVPALAEGAKLWVAYPKAASKIVSDLNREASWECICKRGFESIHETCLDHVWGAIRFQKTISEGASKAGKTLGKNAGKDLNPLSEAKVPGEFQKLATHA